MDEAFAVPTTGTAKSRSSEELEGKPCGELKGSRQTVGADFLKGSEVAWAGVGHQVTLLIWRHGIAAGSANRVVLQLVDAIAVLDVIICMVEQIEGLYLEFQILAFADYKTACQSDVDAFQPRTVK
jgi:hypothetical protein